MTFNLIDILLLVLVLLSMLGGYRCGFILGVLDLAGWVLSLLAGLRFYPPVRIGLALMFTRCRKSGIVQLLLSSSLSWWARRFIFSAI